MSEILGELPALNNHAPWGNFVKNDTAHRNGEALVYYTWEI